MTDNTFFDRTVESEIRENGVYASTTKGTSMRPLFKTNRDVVILKRCESEPKRYDVVLYKDAAGKYLLHRVIRVKDSFFIIRGDNTYRREVVAKDRIIAVLTDYNRKGKKRSTNDVTFRIYSRFWCLIYPLRLLIHKGLSLARRVYRKLFKRKK
jgi:signal peptidase I